MNETPETGQEKNILGKFASVVGLVSAGLFFGGWIYRWSYFSFFQLEVTSLSLPAESYLFVPLQIFLGDSGLIWRTVCALVVVAIAIQVSIGLIGVMRGGIVGVLEQLASVRTNLRGRGRGLVVQVARKWAKLSLSQLQSRGLLSLVNEIVVVVWVLVVIFWLARWQGIADARRDAGEKSTLPVVALITSEEKMVIGRRLDDVFLDPPIKGYRIIGDRGLFEDVRGKEDTDVSDVKQQRIWRVLLESGDWIYLFPTLSANAKAEERPLVLGIQKGEQGHIIIRSPEVSKTQSP